jgi:DNA-binding NtrC family response regulator
LIGVSSRYCEAFAAWAADKGIEAVVCDLKQAADYSREAVLCVYQSSRREGLVEYACDIVRETQTMPLVILSPKISIWEAAQIIQAGVQDVIPIPAAPQDVLARAAVRARRLPASNHDERLIGKSPAIERVRRELRAVASLDSTVLISGETGSGKGLAARLLHDLSRRHSHPFIHADCSGLSGSLIESELFGHERGAFTGAVASRVGRFEAAAGGTLFLDEIAELNHALQSKLLRALQDRTYERLGSSRPRVMSARIVAATNRNLESEVSTGRFRRDLFFRLNVIRIDMPPLRERPEDISLLADTVIRHLANRLGVGVPAIPERLLGAMIHHDWPGNVRELTNVLERFLVQYHGGLFGAAGLNGLIGTPTSRQISIEADSAGLSWPGRPEEKRFLAAELAAEGGNVSRLARRLGVARSTLRYRIARHGISHRAAQR